MPYHVKSVGALGTGDIYYKEGNQWTGTYADRKQYSNKSDADAVAATEVTRTIGTTSFKYQPDIYKNSTVVTE
tara:strand:+ start:149 stop:367 length:219 start_codon:yes stop_codon:yes gene_type:complete